jgi:protein SCO1/2
VIRALRLAAASLTLLLALTLAAPARAAFWTSKGVDSTTPTDVTPAVLEAVRVDEQLGAQLPLDATFTDAAGLPVQLGSVFGQGKPVVLALVYYDCPMLCGLIMSGMARAMRENGLELGKDFTAVTISFDPEEKPPLARERQRGYLQSIGLAESSGAWRFWVDRAGASRRLGDAVGFHYAKDAATGEWAHMASIFVLTPDGKVSRYLYGIDFPPKDFRLSLVEAAGGRVGTSFDKLILTCFRYDPASRKYQPFAFGMLRLGGAAAMVGLAGLIAGLIWRERRKARPTA